MPYNLVLPNGVTLSDIPDDTPREDVRKAVLERFPELGAKTSRTWGETGADIAASLGKGVAQIGQLPGQVGKLAGVYGPGEEDTGIEGAARKLEAISEEAKSPVLKAREATRAKKIADAEGFLNEFTTAFSETAKDPALLSSFFFEQVPNLIGSAGFGGLARGGVKVLMRNASKDALEAASSRAGLTGVITGNAIMQGADIGTDTYNQIFSRLTKEGMPEEQAQGIALAKGRMAAIEAAGISAVATKLPGAQSMERFLARAPKTGSFLGGTFGEAFSEAVEEGGGALVKNLNIRSLFPETSAMKGVGAAAGMGAVGGALLGGASNVFGAGVPEQAAPPAPPPPPAAPPAPPAGGPLLPPPAAPAAPGLMPPPPAPLAPPSAGPVPPSTPLRMTPEGTPERDLFGVVPQQQAPDTKAMVGPEMPVLEPLPGAQAEIPFAGQGELFTGREPVQPPRTPTVEPVAKPPAPIDIPATVKTVVEGAKQNPAASKLLRANNPATAAVVEQRVQEMMPQANNDPIVAIEQLYTQDKTGKYPAGTKPLSEAQRELLESIYHNLTGVDIEQAIRNREFLGATQEDFFAQPQPTEPGAAAPNVGVPGEPGAATPPEGTGGGVGVGVVPGQPPVAGPTGGAGAQPTALSPEQAWERHREAGVHPAYGELDPEEKAAWDRAVKAGRGTGINFTGVVNAYNQRTAATAPRTAAQVKEALDQFGKEMSEDIEDNLAGKSFIDALKFLMNNGPKANREIAKAIFARAKEMMAHGYKFKFAVARDPAGVRRIGGYNYGVLGRVQPDYFKKVMDISVAGKNSGQPFGAQYRTMTHESLHAVTAAMVDYGMRNPNTKIGRLVKELKQLSTYVREHLEAKEARGEKLTASEERVLNGTNALGNSLGAGRRYNQEHEMIAHGMTSSFMQEVLETIPYTAKKQTAFTRFIEIVREMLGLTPKADTALTRVISLTEQLMEAPVGAIASEAGRAKGRGAPAAPLTSAVPIAPGPTNIPAPGQKYTLPKLTKLQAAPTTANKVKGIVQKTQNAYNDSSFWTRFRIGWVDPTSGLAKTLQKLPAFQNGQLRADMLVRSFSQVINLIKNGLQSGIPVINTDGTVIIRRDASNLARSQKVADGLDSNPIVKGSGMSGRDYVAEIARIKRGEEIMQIDAGRRAKAAQMMQEARNKMQQAKLMRAAGAPLTQILKIVNEAKALRQRYRSDLTVNREKQVTQSHITWADQQLAAVPEVQEVFNIWRDVNVGLLDLWQEAGLLTQAQADYYRSMKNYVPLFAAREDLAPADQETYTGKAGGTKSVRELDHLSGSDLQRNIWENQDKLYASMTAAAYQNQTRKVAVQQLKSLSAAHIAKNADDPDVNLRYRDPSNPDADANGIVHAVVDNPNDVAAFQAMHYELGPLMKALAGSTQLLRATALINPMYWIKQLIRDPMHASLVTNSGIVTPFHSASEFAKIIAGQSEEAKLLASRGVIGQVDSTIDLHDFLKQAGTEKLSPSMLDKALHKVMQVHEASDAATRVAIFKKAKQDGLKKGMSEAEATDYGVFVARESINFAVRGNSKTLNALRNMIPFMSASITSLDTLYRAASGYGLNPEEKAQIQRVFYSRAAVMAILSTVYAMSLQDDDDYKRLPDNVKDNNWLMPNPWGTDGKSFIKIPVPFEIGFFFKTIPEAAVRYMSGTSTGKEMLASILGGVKHNMPGEGILIPQAVKPGLEAIMNYSFFTQRPIEGMSDQGKPVAERGPNASEFAKTLSKLGLDKIGLSPAKIDYLIQGYTAELGTFTTGLASTLIAEANGKVPPYKNLEEKPFFKSFMTNPNTSEAASDFYEIAHTAQETVNSYNDKVKRGLKEEAKYIASDEEKRKLMLVAPMLRGVQNNMALIRSQINVLKEKSDLDPEERRLRINKLMERYDQQAQKGYAILEKAGIER